MTKPKSFIVEKYLEGAFCMLLSMFILSCATTTSEKELLKKYDSPSSKNSELVIDSMQTTESLTGSPVTEISTAKNSGAPSKIEKLNEELTRKNQIFKRTISTADYKIGPEDLLELNVFEVNELNTTTRVSASGYIKLPLIGKIKVEGLTVSELETLVSKKLEKYLEEPVVSVFIKEYRSQPITVIGSVRNPRVYYVRGQRYLLDIISMAGGLNPDAGGICIIQRTLESERGKAYEKIVIDLNELLINGRAELNVPLESGDIVHVPKAGVFFVDGAVKSPGAFQLKRQMTLTQAISMAKGLTFDAIRSDIRIYRDTGKAEREVISVDYDSIINGETPDIPINDRDIILISDSGFKRFVRRITTSFSLGIFRFGAGF